MRLDHRTLRAIGQDLETIGVFDFDLELEGERCVVRGTVASPASPEPSPTSRGLKDLWKGFRQRESDVPSDLAPVPVERVYLPDDIDRLVAEGQSHRQDRQAEAAFHYGDSSGSGWLLQNCRFAACECLKTWEAAQV